MGRGERIWDRLSGNLDLPEETLPGQPIVEIAGTGRVLIENHRGVQGYSREEVCVGVRYGSVRICGCNLEIMRMNQYRLLVCGSIHSVTLLRRG